MLDIMAIDYPKMQYICVALKKIKDIQMQLEASDQLSFILIRTKMQIDAVPECSLGAISSQHAQPSTLVGSDSQPSTAQPSLLAEQGRQHAGVMMTSAIVGDAPAVGDTIRS